MTTAPKPTSDVSVQTAKGNQKFGNSGTELDENLSFSIIFVDDIKLSREYK